ncbi:MAG TPA: hypothetical protein VKZ74_02990 [Natronosporangium sp.]|nr:hypothetical protein [Natronosporangium sp.]
MTRSKTELRARAELPAAVYAAAGAGDLAYQRLRKLPEATARTLRTAGQTAGALRERLVSRELTAELSQMRVNARRRAEALAARAAKAQERAVAGYRNLVAHGEQVVNQRFGATTGHAEPTKVEVVVGEPERAGEPDDERETPAVSAGPPTTTAPRRASGSTTRGASKAGPRAPSRRAAV